MILLYGGPTPNSRKVAILLEELGLEWRLEFVDVMRGDQLTPAFLKLNPNNKTPVIVEDDGFTLAESGAILWYLAARAGRFIPPEPRAQAVCHQWLMFQVSGVGPMVGQAAHFNAYAAEKHPYAIGRYNNEVTRLLGVVDRRLGESEHLAGEAYTVADIATYPYTLRQAESRRAEFPNLARWSDAIGARPAVRRGMEVGRENVRQETIEGGLSGLTDEHRSILFGERQYAPR